MLTIKIPAALLREVVHPFLAPVQVHHRIYPKLRADYTQLCQQIRQRYQQLAEQRRLSRSQEPIVIRERCRLLRRDFVWKPRAPYWFTL